MSEQTVFSKIISREIPAAIIDEDESTLAFLDHNPVTKGHCLVISKQPIDHLDDCDEDLYLQIFSMVHRMSKLIKERLRPERVAIIVHGYEIPHAHVHVVPVYSHGDIKFPTRPDRVVSQDELSGVLRKLKNNANA